MTLRLRLTLVYTALVAVVLAASGVGLHVLLARGLYLSLDESLEEAAGLLLSFMEQDETPRLESAPSGQNRFRVPPCCSSRTRATSPKASGASTSAS